MPARLINYVDRTYLPLQLNPPTAQNWTPNAGNTIDARDRSLEADLRSSERQNQELLKEMDDFKAWKSGVERTLSSMLVEMEQVRNENSKLRDRVEQLDTENSKLRGQIKQLQVRDADLQTEIRENQLSNVARFRAVLEQNARMKHSLSLLEENVKNNLSGLESSYSQHPRSFEEMAAVAREYKQSLQGAKSSLPKAAKSDFSVKSLLDQSNKHQRATSNNLPLQHFEKLTRLPIFE